MIACLNNSSFCTFLLICSFKYIVAEELTFSSWRTTQAVTPGPTTRPKTVVENLLEQLGNSFFTTKNIGRGPSYDKEENSETRCYDEKVHWEFSYIDDQAVLAHKGADCGTWGAEWLVRRSRAEKILYIKNRNFVRKTKIAK